MNVAQVDDKTVDVTMTTSFRAHFSQPIAELAAGNMAQREAARAAALELPAPGDASAFGGRDTFDSFPGTPGVGETQGDAALVLGGRGGVTPGADGGRFGIASPDDYVSDAYGARASKALMLGDAAAAADVRAAAEWTIAPDELRLRERVAVGGFAEVFRATWNGTTVAVKQLLERGPDVVERLREEVLTLCRLRHPNLLLFMGWCADPPLIATEFMRRGSLHSILRANGGHLGAPRTHHAAVSVAKGMQYLHSRSPPILHLDLKSPNILVDDKWRVKIADFGLARARRNTLVSGRSGFHGTPEWMAPEMLRAEDYDEKADSYSYGVVLWELLAAQTPWNELHPMQVVAVVGYSDRRLTLPPEAKDFAQENLVTRAIADLFWECASKTPRTRPGFDEILERLERAPGMLLPGPELKERTGTTQTSRFTLREDVPDAKNVAPKRAKAPDVSGEASAASADGAAPLGARGVPAAGVEIEEITALEDAPSKRVSAVSAEMKTRGEEYVVHEDEEA
jgi:serine/threonine protein kinase